MERRYFNPDDYGDLNHPWTLRLVVYRAFQCVILLVFMAFTMGF